MKKILVLTPFVVLAFGLAAAGEEVKGIIRKVDPDKKEVMIEARGRGVRGLPMAFTVGPQTNILLGKEPGALSDLQPGEHVVLSYEARDGQKLATGIAVRGAVKKPTPASQDLVTGTLARVDDKERQIVVIGPGPKGEGDTEMSLAVPKEVRVTRDQKVIAFEDLKEGEEVAVRLDKEADKPAAKEILVGKMAPRTETSDQRRERLRMFMKIAEKAFEQMQEKKAQQPPRP